MHQIPSSVNMMQYYHTGGLELKPLACINICISFISCSRSSLLLSDSILCNSSLYFSSLSCLFSSTSSNLKMYTIDPFSVFIWIVTPANIITMAKKVVTIKFYQRKVWVPEQKLLCVEIAF